MDTAGCITNEMWQRYAEGRLDAQETEHLKLHASSCPICVDMLEGIDSMTNPRKLGSRIDEINRKVDVKLGSNRPVIKFGYFLAAAALILASGLSWMMFTQKDTEMIALKKDPVVEDHQPTKNKDEKLVPQGSPNTPAVKEPKKKKAPIALIPEKETFKEHNGQALPASQRLDFSDASVTEDLSKVPTTEKVEEKALTVTRNLQSDGQALDGKESEDQKPAVAETTQAKRKTSKEIYPGAYNNNAYSNNQIQLSDNVMRDSVSPQYSAAHDYFEQGKYDSCKLALAPLISDPHALDHEPALMLMAKTYIAEDDHTQARIYLKSVIALKGPQRKEAERLLRTLK